MENNSFVRKVNNIFDIPAEAEGLEVRIVLLGNHSLRIENHKGLRCYDIDKVVVQCPKGFLHISGENMLLTVFNREEILIEGSIETLSFKKEEV